MLIYLINIQIYLLIQNVFSKNNDSKFDNNFIFIFYNFFNI